MRRPPVVERATSKVPHAFCVYVSTFQSGSWKTKMKGKIMKEIDQETYVKLRENGIVLAISTQDSKKEECICDLKKQRRNY